MGSNGNHRIRTLADQLVAAQRSCEEHKRTVERLRLRAELAEESRSALRKERCELAGELADARKENEELRDELEAVRDEHGDGRAMSGRGVFPWRSGMPPVASVRADELRSAYLQGYDDARSGSRRRSAGNRRELRNVEERTCENESEPAWKCGPARSRCGYCCDLYEPQWRPGCGARVAGHRERNDRKNTE